MASLLAGARLVLSQGARFFPAYRVRPAAGTVRCLTGSARFLTTAVPDTGAVSTEPSEPKTYYQSRFDGWSMHSVGVKLKKSGRISKNTFLNVFESLCEKGTLSDSQASFLLHICGSSLPGVPMAEHTAIANKVWKKIQDMGVACTADHYNALLKIYIDNENKFSPTDFLAGMEAARVQPNQITYERLIAVYCNEGNLEGASNILGFLKSRNLPITEGIFSYLIRGHARAGDMESAKNMLSVMQEAGLTPGGSTYTELLVAYAAKNDVEGFKQILSDCKPHMLESVCQSVIYSLAKAGHTQFLPDIFEHMSTPIQYRELINLCVKLLAQGCGDTALELTKRFIPDKHRDDFMSQQGCFFIRQCVDLNMPIDTMKKYLSELKDCGLHRSPLQFALMCALQDDNQGLALDIMKAIQEEELPLEPHYFWPMLASCRRKDDVKGCFQVLKSMYEMKAHPNFNTFQNFFFDLFPNGEYPESLLQDQELQKEFNEIYMSTLKRGMLKGELKRVYILLSSGMPLVADGGLHRLFQKVFFKSHDVEILAKITKLLCQDRSSLQKSSPETDPVGYFLCGLIVNMSDLEALGKEEHLKQYFHQLKEMGVTLGAMKAARMYQLLRSANLSLLIEDVKKLVPLYDMDKRISELEEEVENKKVNGEPINTVLTELLYNLVEKEDLEKVVELTLKYQSDFNLGMFLKVIGLCCRKNDPVKALQIKEEVSRRKFPALPSKLKYLELVKLLALNDHMEDAINILKEMQERNVTVNRESGKAFATILNTLAKKGDVDGVHRLHEHLVMLGLAKPTNQLCEALVQVHIVREDLSAALDAMIDCNNKYKFSKMHPLLLNLINKEETELLKKAVDYIYNTFGERIMLHNLLFAFLESGNYTEAQKIAETPGLRAIPSMLNWFAYHLRYHGKEDCLEQCLEITRNLFGVDREEMYYQLLALYDKNKKFEKAMELWDNMNENGVAIPEKTSYLFRQLFARSGQDILAHIPEFEQKYEEIDDCSAKVLDLCKESKYIEAFNVILMANETDKLTKSAYAHAIKGLLEAGQLDDALKVEAIARRHYREYSIKKVSYNLLLAEQVRQDCLKEALVSLKSMLWNDSLPSRFVLNRLSQAFALKGDLAGLDEMEALTKSSIQNLPKLDRQYFVCRIVAHFVNGNFDEGTSMIESQCTQDPDDLNGAYLVTALMRNNLSEALEKVSIVAERLGNQFSNYKLVTNLFLEYVQFNKLEEAKQLIQRCNGILEQRELLKSSIARNTDQTRYIHRLVTLLEEYDPSYKEYGYNALLKEKVLKQNLDDALELYEKMKAENMESDAECLKQLAVLLRMADRAVPFPEPLDTVEYSSSDESESDTQSPSEDKH